MNVKNEKSLGAEWKNMKDDRNPKSFETIYVFCFLICTLHTRCPTSNNLPNKSEGFGEVSWQAPVKSVNILACFEIALVFQLHEMLQP